VESRREGDLDPASASVSPNHRGRRLALTRAGAMANPTKPGYEYALPDGTRVETHRKLVPPSKRLLVANALWPKGDPHHQWTAEEKAGVPK